MNVLIFKLSLKLGTLILQSLEKHLLLLPAAYLANLHYLEYSGQYHLADSE